ncbi:uncharacterized protein BX663DRAFT_504920 [Cokeromyces recurvatus]|uniref:uncharacterized protein n=1 Tax=Cokeromyces recurvatus TaxID=90255 RepID=UPI00221FB160|nr:uncharacterized protein BX663DRAFT_504920 [Cokeromyces recurvatus]KAI7904395.1 hypothetical protein BX663DRAFT_504920 [Cokeromyces recurvatus]
MSITDSPSQDIKLTPDSLASSSIEQSQEQYHHHPHHSLKKPRNYKYWSDNEVRRILHWLTLPENEGKLVRNKAQACREVAKVLFNGDEYMAISIRSKLMALEKAFREAEQLRLQLDHHNEAMINDKVKEVNKFYKECKQLFGGIQQNDSINHSPTNRHYHLPSSSRLDSNDIIISTLDHNNKNYSNPLLPPHLTNEDSQPLRPLSNPNHTSTTTTTATTSWNLPRVSSSSIIDLPLPSPSSSSSLDQSTMRQFSLKRSREEEEESKRVKIARYAAKQAEHERYKMQYAIQLAKINLERDSLAIKKVELELELAKLTKKRQDD